MYLAWSAGITNESSATASASKKDKSASREPAGERIDLNLYVIRIVKSLFMY